MVHGYPPLPVTYNLPSHIHFPLPILLAGDIAEMLIYNKALTTQEMDRLANYLKVKYSLPSVRLNDDVASPLRSMPLSKVLSFLCVGWQIDVFLRSQHPPLTSLAHSTAKNIIAPSKATTITVGCMNSNHSTQSRAPDLLIVKSRFFNGLYLENL